MSTMQAGRQATVSVDVGASDLRFETGKLAKQADGAVVVRSGDTMILATAVGRRRRFLDYLQRKDLEGYRALIKELGLRR